MIRKAKYCAVTTLSSCVLVFSPLYLAILRMMMGRKYPMIPEMAGGTRPATAAKVHPLAFCHDAKNGRTPVKELICAIRATASRGTALMNKTINR